MFTFLDWLHDKGYIKAWFTWIEWLTLTAALIVAGNKLESDILYVFGGISAVLAWWSGTRGTLLVIADVVREKPWPALFKKLLVYPVAILLTTSVCAFVAWTLFGFLSE